MYHSCIQWYFEQGAKHDIPLFQVWGSHSSEDDSVVLPGSDTMTHRQILMFWRNMLSQYSGLKMQTFYFPKLLASTYKSTQHQSPEDQHSHHILLICKSCVSFLIMWLGYIIHLNKYSLTHRLNRSPICGLAIGILLLSSFPDSFIHNVLLWVPVAWSSVQRSDNM